MSRAVFGVDVSGWQHPYDEAIDWHQVKAHGIGAAYIKATEGTGYVNAWLDRDGNGAHDAGVAVGYYHFAHPSQSDPHTQAEHFMGAIEGLPRSIGAVLDLELSEGLSPAALDAWGSAFMNYLVGVKYRVLYTYNGFLSAIPTMPWGHSLWLADLQGRPRRELWGWQYSDSAVVPGIPGKVDADVFYLP